MGPHELAFWAPERAVWAQRAEAGVWCEVLRLLWAPRLRVVTPCTAWPTLPLGERDSQRLPAAQVSPDPSEF